jgi:arylsulfatase
MTAMIGKNHNTPTWETKCGRAFRPLAQRPRVSIISTASTAATRISGTRWFFENHNLVTPSTDPNYHLTVDLADHAISWVRQVKSIAPDRPFFSLRCAGRHARAASRPAGVDRSVQGTVSTWLGQIS